MGVTSVGSKVIVTNNGPALSGTPITFYAHLIDHPVDEYDFEFRDHHVPDKLVYIRGNDTASATFTFTEEELAHGGDHQMKVIVWFLISGEREWEVTSNDTTYTVTGNLTGDLLVSQSGHPPNEGTVRIVAVDQPVDITFQLHDPSDYFRDFDLKYKWNVEGLNIGSMDSTLKYTFSIPKLYNVSVQVEAKSRSDPEMMRYGFKSQLIDVQKPLDGAELDGRMKRPVDQPIDEGPDKVTSGSLIERIQSKPVSEAGGNGLSPLRVNSGLLVLLLIPFYFAFGTY
jgi:hypothetical protein